MEIQHYEYSFNRKIRLARIVWSIIYIALILFLFGTVSSPERIIKSPEGTTRFDSLSILATALVMLAYFIATVSCRRWVFQKIQLTNGGIHVKIMRQQKFVPWENVQAIERDHICFWKIFRSPVIICRLASKQPNGPEREQHKKRVQDYFQLRDEIVLLSYTRERMIKIQAFHRAKTER